MAPAIETTLTTWARAGRTRPGPRGGAEPRQQGACAPDAAEVVDAQHPLHEIEVGVHERVSLGDAGVVHEQMHGRVALEHTRRHGLDRLPVADVADLELTAELLGERTEPLLAARDEHAVPVPLGELAGDGLADPRRRSGDDRDSRFAHGRTLCEGAKAASHRIAP